MSKKDNKIVVDDFVFRCSYRLVDGVVQEVEATGMKLFVVDGHRDPIIIPFEVPDYLVGSHQTFYLNSLTNELVHFEGLQSYVKYEGSSDEDWEGCIDVAAKENLAEIRNAADRKKLDVLSVVFRFSLVAVLMGIVTIALSIFRQWTPAIITGAFTIVMFAIAAVKSNRINTDVVCDKEGNCVNFQEKSIKLGDAVYSFPV